MRAVLLRSCGASRLWLLIPLVAAMALAACQRGVDGTAESETLTPTVSVLTEPPSTQSPSSGVSAFPYHEILVRSGDAEQEINALALDRSTSHLAVGTDSGINLYQIDRVNITKLWSVSTDSRVMSLEFSPDGTSLISGSYDGTVASWNVASGQLSEELQKHAGPVSSVHFSADGAYLASGAYDGKVLVWDMSHHQLQQIYEGQKGIVNDIAWSPDGDMIASASLDSTVVIWNLHNNQRVLELRGHALGAEAGVESVAWSPDGNWLASGGDDAQVIIWNAHTGEILRVLPVALGRVNHLAWSPDSTLLATGSYGPVKVWNVNTGQEFLALEGHTDWVTGLSWSSDGKVLATASSDGKVILWELRR